MSLAHPGTRVRERRMRLFFRLMQAGPGTRILDVGGNPQIWETVTGVERPDIVYLNLPRAFEPGDDSARLVFADGTRLPFVDQSFDIVFSNSVIEHVGDAAAQARFAGEIQRVGRAYWVQTPNLRFPVEQHLLTPFVHWLPKSLQRPVVPYVNVWRWVAKPTEDRAQFYYDHYLNDIRLLTAGQLRQLFPGARLVRERFLGLTKSLIVLKTNTR